MKILYDHEMFTRQRYGGITRYFANLHYSFGKYEDVTSRIALLYTKNEYIKQEPFLFNNMLGKKLFAGRFNRTYRWNQRYCEWMIKLADYDVFHPTYFDPYFLKYNRKPFVLTVHDMIYEQLPHLFDNATEVIAQKKLLIEKADAIIAISEHTKRDILKFFPSVEEKITVVHHGYAASNSEMPAQLNVPDNYLLFVGERWLYKNFEMFVKAVAPLLRQDAGLNLVCAGGGSFNDKELALLSDLQITQKCRQLNATEGELIYLYRHAQLFIFPSLQEGFGFPLLEAFAQDCLVACSNTTCMPEIAGNAAVYFDPTDERSIADVITKILADKTLQEDLKSKAIDRLRLFTIEACVAKTAEVYRSVLK